MTVFLHYSLKTCVTIFRKGPNRKNIARDTNFKIEPKKTKQINLFYFFCNTRTWQLHYICGVFIYFLSYFNSINFEMICTKIEIISLISNCYRKIKIISWMTFLTLCMLNSILLYFIKPKSLYNKICIFTL